MGVRIPERDESGAELTRIKGATAGYTYQARAIEFHLSDIVTAISNHDENGTGYGDATVKFFDASNVELLTQVDIDASCVKTVMEWSPTYDLDMVGGHATILTKPATTESVKLFVNAAPILADKRMIQGPDFKYQKHMELDGRFTKHMQRIEAAPGLFANTFQVTVTHPVGYQNSVEIIMEHYRP